MNSHLVFKKWESIANCFKTFRCLPHQSVRNKKPNWLRTSMPHRYQFSMHGRLSSLPSPPPDRGDRARGSVCQGCPLRFHPFGASPWQTEPLAQIRINRWGWGGTVCHRSSKRLSCPAAFCWSRFFMLLKHFLQMQCSSPNSLFRSHPPKLSRPQ